MMQDINKLRINKLALIIYFKILFIDRIKL
jgi:hypothetical protein